MQTMDEIHRRLMEKSSSDPEFRRRLVEDPKSVIQQETGIEIHDGFTVHVHENDMNTIHLSLPATELPEEHLESIAAGRCCCSF